MLHLGDDHGHSSAWRWGLVIAAAALIVYAALELRDMRERVRYLERQTERLMWRRIDKNKAGIPQEHDDGRDQDHGPDRR